MPGIRKDYEKRKALIKRKVLLEYRNPFIPVGEILKRYNLARNTLLAWAKEEDIPMRRKGATIKYNNARIRTSLRVDKEVFDAFKEEAFLIKKYPDEVMEWLMRSWVITQIEDRINKQRP